MRPRGQQLVQSLELRNELGQKSDSGCPGRCKKEREGVCIDVVILGVDGATGRVLIGFAEK